MGVIAFGLSGQSFPAFLQSLDAMGVFTYVLPFLLIFAFVFAILSMLPLFKDKKGINMIVSLSVGLMSLSFDFVPVFFSEIFPRAGIGIAVVLVALILAGAFIDWTDSNGKMKPFVWIFFGIGALAFLLVIANSFASFSVFGSGWWDEYGFIIIMAVLIIAAVVAVMVGGEKNPKPTPPKPNGQ